MLRPGYYPKFQKAGRPSECRAHPSAERLVRHRAGMWGPDKDNSSGRQHRPDHSVVRFGGSCSLNPKVALKSADIFCSGVESTTR